MERPHEMQFRNGRHRGLINPSHQKPMGAQGQVFIPCHATIFGNELQMLEQHEVYKA